MVITCNLGLNMKYGEAQFSQHVLNEHVAGIFTQQEITTVIILVWGSINK